MLLLLLQFPTVGQLVFEMRPYVSVKRGPVVAFQPAYGASGGLSGGGGVSFHGYS